MSYLNKMREVGIVLASDYPKPRPRAQSLAGAKLGTQAKPGPAHHYC
jgi:hypothetical protein